MEVSILTVSNSELVTATCNDSLSLLASTLYKNGFIIKSNNIIRVNSTEIEQTLKLLYSQNNCIIVVVQDQIDYSFLVKKEIAKLFNEEIETNIYAKNNIALYYKNANLPQPKEIISYAYMPNSARAIVNEIGPMQGFLIKKDNKLLFFMPYEATELKNMFVTSVLPFMIGEENKTNNTSIFKTFGLKQNEMLSILKDLRKNKQNVNIICNEKLLEGEIIINYPKKLDQVVVDGFVSTIYKRLSAYIYADSDVTLAECLYNILTLKNSTITCAEDATCGLFTSNFYKSNINGNNFLKESYIVPTNEAKTKILGVEENVFKQSKIDHNEIVYQMALGALENASTDYVVSTYSVDKKLYLGIGNIDGIHVYSQIFEGSKEELITKFTSATYFNLIKKVRKNDFHLPQTTI